MVGRDCPTKETFDPLYPKAPSALFAVYIMVQPISHLITDPSTDLFFLFLQNIYNPVASHHFHHYYPASNLHYVYLDSQKSLQDGFIASTLSHLEPILNIRVIPLEQKPDPVTFLLKIPQWLPWLSKSNGVKAKVHIVTYGVLPDLDPTLPHWCSPATALLSHSSQPC